MDATCPFHPKGKHAAKDCYSLQDYIKEHIKDPAQGALDQNQDQQQGGPAFPDLEHQLNMIFGGSVASESKRKQKLAAREINALTPATPKYLRWSELPITFDRSDHPGSVPYPCLLSPGTRPHHPDGQTKQGFD